MIEAATWAVATRSLKFQLRAETEMVALVVAVEELYFMMWNSMKEVFYLFRLLSGEWHASATHRNAVLSMRLQEVQ